MTFASRVKAKIFKISIWSVTPTFKLSIFWNADCLWFVDDNNCWYNLGQCQKCHVFKCKSIDSILVEPKFVLDYYGDS